MLIFPLGPQPQLLAGREASWGLRHEEARRAARSCVLDDRRAWHARLDRAQSLGVLVSVDVVGPHDEGVLVRLDVVVLAYAGGMEAEPAVHGLSRLVAHAHLEGEVARPS